MTPPSNARIGRGRLWFAWAGGVLFVAALVYFAWFYFARLGRPAPGALSPRQALAVNVALFALFGLHHSIMARPSAKTWFGRLASPELERATFVWVSSVLLAIVCSAWQRIPGEVYRVAAPWAWVLYGLQGTGVWLTLRASGRLDVLELAGIRQVQAARRARHAIDGSPAHSRALNPLQVRGPYRLVRHPVYLGWVLMVFGAPVMTVDRMAFAVISTLYLVIATPLEERALRTAFGESYDEYSRRVRWRIVPGIY
jgi:protein-S-isoprenylcysteine O-methyltransferase Ste14